MIRLLSKKEKAEINLAFLGASLKAFLLFGSGILFMLPPAYCLGQITPILISFTALSLLQCEFADLCEGACYN